MGAQILIGRRNGERNFDKIGEIVIQGILFLFVPAILLIAVFKFGFAASLMGLFESDNERGSFRVSRLASLRVCFAFTNSAFGHFTSELPELGC